MLGAKLVVLQERFLALEEQLAATVRENEEMRAALELVAADRAKQPTRTSVVCELAPFLGREHLSLLKATLEGKKRTEKIQEIQVQRWVSPLLQQLKEVLGCDAKEPHKFEFAAYVQARRSSKQFCCDCLCGVETQDSGMQFGQFLLFSDHIEVISVEGKVLLFSLDEIATIEQQCLEDQSYVLFVIRETASVGQAQHTLFFDTLPSQLTHCLSKLQQLLRDRIQVTCDSPSSTATCIRVSENERKAVGWSGSYLLPGMGDPAHFVDEESGEALDSRPLFDAAPPKGHRWVQRDWLIDTSRLVAEIKHVQQQSAAAAAGIQQGDLILQFTSRAQYPLFGMQTFAGLSHALSQGAIELVLYRKQSESWVHAYLVSHEGQFGIDISQAEGWEYARSFQGPWHTAPRWTSCVRRRFWVRHAAQQRSLSTSPQRVFARMQSLTQEP